MSMGDHYAYALSEGLRLVSTVEKLDLKANRLTDMGSAAILASI